MYYENNLQLVPELEDVLLREDKRSQGSIVNPGININAKFSSMDTMNLSNELVEEVHYLKPPVPFIRPENYRIPLFRELMLFNVPDDIKRVLKTRGMSVQSMYNAYGDFNLDNYSLVITKLPSFASTQQKLLTYIRANFNSFIDKDIAQFYPYGKEDGPKWYSPSYTGAVMNISMTDNGAVVASNSNTNYWIFSTITAPDPGEHPVSGHRLFSLRGIKGSDACVFTVAGVDRTTNAHTYAAAALAETPFIVADWLWYGLIDNIAKEIEANGGKVVRRRRYSSRHTADNVNYYVSTWRKQGITSQFNRPGFIYTDIE